LLQLIGGTSATIGFVIYQLVSQNGLGIDWPLGLSIIAVLGGVQLLGLGLLAHLGFRIYYHLKSRPRFVVKNHATLGLRHDKQPEAAEPRPSEQADAANAARATPEPGSKSEQAPDRENVRPTPRRAPEGQRRAG
jgi:hypothetical protein